MKHLWRQFDFGPASVAAPSFGVPPSTRSLPDSTVADNLASPFVETGLLAVAW